MPLIIEAHKVARAMNEYRKQRPVVLAEIDIFIGAGTTAVVAKKLNRHWLGIELNPEYIKMANSRIKHTHVQQTLF